ncbi:MAG TPA: winged helix-turn-helix domain-containing protein [Solirubrobacteraceae bacterium]|nr:winged helix-turn-helix domain-containing protein [Solirubrobacteraceae bacterium]
MARRRRTGPEVLEAGPLTVVPSERLARAGGRTLMLSIRELELLTELARRPDRILAREELFELVWGGEMPARTRSVDVYVRKLRVKLAAAVPGWTFIHTHFRLGYRLAPVPVDDASAPGRSRARSASAARGGAAANGRG